MLLTTYEKTEIIIGLFVFILLCFVYSKFIEKLTIWTILWFSFTFFLVLLLKNVVGNYSLITMND